MNNLNAKKNVYPVSLSHYLSLSGIASRRKSTEIIKQGMVKVNDVKITNPGMKINIDDIVLFNNKIVELEQKIYIMLNKPKGYICTSDDPYAEKKILDLVNIPNVRLFTAGRLDKDSEGLIIITNDGNYTNKLMHPSNEIEKCYIVKINNTFTHNVLKELKNGITDDSEFLKPISIEPLGNTTYKIILNEGKKREIRRMIRFADRRVLSLKRIRVGNLFLNDLPTGKWKELNNDEINQSLQSI